MAANTTRYIAKVLFTNGSTCGSQEFSREAAEAYIARFEIGGRIEAVRIDEFAEGDSVRWSW